MRVNACRLIHVCAYMYMCACVYYVTILLLNIKIKHQKLPNKKTHLNHMRKMIIQQKPSVNQHTSTQFYAQPHPSCPHPNTIVFTCAQLCKNKHIRTKLCVTNPYTFFDNSQHESRTCRFNEFLFSTVQKPTNDGWSWSL